MSEGGAIREAVERAAARLVTLRLGPGGTAARVDVGVDERVGEGNWRLCAWPIACHSAHIDQAIADIRRGIVKVVMEELGARSKG